jgi:hypothetical protein
MLYVYRQRNSTGARDLAEGIMLKGTLARRTKGEALRRLVPGDAVVCWGSNFAAPANIKTLNNVPPINKFSEAQKLTEKGVATIQVDRVRPAGRVVARPVFVENTFELQAAPRLGTADAAEIAGRLARFVAEERARRAAWELQPAAPAETWLPRRNNHIGGNDLLEENLRDPDFFSKKENIVEEYRLHMFRGKSIRAGKKVARPTRPDGRTAAHPWIRSFDAGWVIDYAGFQSTKAMRELGRKALKALDLDFGAIDMGLKADGSLIVLEVNRAPGVEGGTVESYATHIINWAAGRDEEGRD